MTKLTLASKDWMRFCREFTAVNRYRRARIAVQDSRNGRLWIERELPFLGLSILSHWGTGGQVTLTASQFDSERLCERQVSVQGPPIFESQEDDGVDELLCVTGSDGTCIEILFSPQQDADPYRSVVEEVAHVLYRRRGSLAGRELTDWLEAEQRVRVAGCLMS